MKTNELLLSSLSITEDDYDYKGSFFLANGAIQKRLDLADLQNTGVLEEIRNTFGLEETSDEIKNILMEMVLEKAQISSKYTEGEEYEQKSSRGQKETIIKSLDMA